LPKFQTFFKSLHAKLPLPTRMLLALGRFFGKWGYVIGAIIVVFAVLGFLATRTQRGREIKDQLLLKIPLIGNLIHTAIMGLCCRFWTSMTIAAVALPEASAVSTAATNNTVFRRGLTNARAAMMRGEGLAGPLAATGLFPGAARQMFAVGESTGNLD